MRQRKFTPSLAQFFEEQGRYLTKSEYAKAPGRPMSGQAIRRIYGSYARMLKAIYTYRREQITLVPAKVDKAAELAAKLAEAKAKAKEVEDENQV